MLCYKRNLSHRATRFVEFNHLLISRRLHHPSKKAGSSTIPRL